jgi:hypothetical protein
MFTKPKKAAKNASDVPKAAPAAQKTPAVHAAAANIRKNKKSGFCRCSIEPLQKNEKHRGNEPPRCFSFRSGLDRSEKNMIYS